MLQVSTVRRRSLWLTAELLAWVIGLALLIGGCVWYVDGVIRSRQALNRFANLKAAAVPNVTTPDVSLWSPERIKEWRIASSLPAATPLAVMRMPRIHLEVPVLEGSDDATLNRGVGHIEDTALPGTDGNSGIAGHRDGFFRGLKDVGVGDAIELEMLNERLVYRIERTLIVDPEDVWVLDPTPSRSLTLVTCYPFYFVGSAPKRYIVRAILAETITTH